MAHRLKKRADGNYQKQIAVGRNKDGSYIRKSIYAPTQKELDEKVRQAQQKIYDGICILDTRTTFEDIAYIWLNDCNPTQNEKWHQRQRLVIENHLLPSLGAMRVTELKQFHLQMLINSKAKAGFSSNSMKQMKQTAVRILDVAIQAETIQRNVFEKVKVPYTPPKERQALNEEQIRVVNETWETHFMGCPAMIMLYCGLRRGELCALQWKDIDLEKDMISVTKAIEILTNQSRIKQPKSKAGIRNIPIPQILHEMLEQVKGDDDAFVCPTRSGQLMTGSAWSSAWNSYMRHLDLYCGGKPASRSNGKISVFTPFSAHMLRHTYATMLYDAGVDIKSAQYFLGHAEIELTLSIYTHLTAFKTDEAIRNLNKHLSENILVETTGDYVGLE